MKKNIWLYYIIGILILSPISISAVETNLNLEEHDTYYVLDFSLGDFQQIEQHHGNLKLTDITISKQPRTFDKGNPALPFFTYSLIIPFDSKEIAFEILQSDESYLSLTPTPSKGILPRTINPEDIDYEFSDVYNNDKLYPEIPVELSEPYILRDFRGITVKITPFAYNGKKKSLTVFNHLRIKISTDNQSIAKTPFRDRIPSDFAALYDNHFINYDNSRYTSLDESGRMIVITYPNFADEIQPLVDWKNSKGQITELYTLNETGTTTTAIKNFIQDKYESDDGLTYVLLVGDIHQVPSFTSSISHTGLSDPMYTQLSGTDYYPEIFIGRFSAETEAQVTTQVEKTIFYERDLITADWPAKGIGVASNQGTGDDNEYDYQHIRNIRTDLMNYTYTLVDELYDGSQGGEDASTWPSSNDVAASINEGRGIATYCGHGSSYSWGSSSFSTSNVNNLTNDYMLPFIISVACVNGEFDSYYPCFAEAWLRATHNGNPSGAVAFYGSSVNQSWDPPMAAQDECIDLLVADDKQTFGGICFNGSCLMMDEYGSYSGADMFNTWHVFGDPSLVLRTMTPQNLVLTSPSSIQPDDAEFTVSSSVANVKICIVDSEYNILFNGSTGSTGNVVVPATDFPDTEQTLTVTATKYNHQTQINTIEIEEDTGSLNPPENVEISLDNTSMTISWDAVSGANSYKIFFSTNPDDGFTLMETVPASTTSKIYPMDTARGFYNIVASEDLPE